MWNVIAYVVGEGVRASIYLYQGTPDGAMYQVQGTIDTRSVSIIIHCLLPFFYNNYRLYNFPIHLQARIQFMYNTSAAALLTNKLTCRLLSWSVNDLPPALKPFYNLPRHSVL
jgi:hypothetical protein